jgi:hypothetical protein
MRKVIFSLLVAAAGAIGLAGSTPAEAYDSGRIFVGIGDVSFSYGRPYWRYNNEPLYVVYERGYPRYYRYADPYYDAGYYAPPPRYYAPVRYYAPPRYGYGYSYGWRDNHRHGHGHRGHGGWDRGRGHDGRRGDGHRGRGRGGHCRRLTARSVEARGGPQVRPVFVCGVDRPAARVEDAIRGRLMP